MTEEEFIEKLNPEQYRVMRKKDTERPYSGKFWDNDEKGIYTCAACGNLLFLSLNQFDAENGWPCFNSSADNGSVEIKKEGEKEEVVCKNCSSHLGYMNQKENEKFFCMNSAALDFNPLPELEDEEDEDDKNEDKDSNSKSSKKIVETPTTLSVKDILILLATALTGAGIGAASGLYVCSVSQNTPVTAIVTSSSTPVIISTPTPRILTPIVTSPKPTVATTAPGTTTTMSSLPASSGTSSSATSSAVGLP